MFLRIHWFISRCHVPHLCVPSFSQPFSLALWLIYQLYALLSYLGFFLWQLHHNQVNTPWNVTHCVSFSPGANGNWVTLLPRPHVHIWLNSVISVSFTYSLAIKATERLLFHPPCTPRQGANLIFCTLFSLDEFIWFPRLTTGVDLVETTVSRTLVPPPRCANSRYSYGNAPLYYHKCLSAVTCIPFIFLGWFSSSWHGWQWAVDFRNVHAVGSMEIKMTLRPGEVCDGILGRALVSSLGHDSEH